MKYTKVRIGIIFIISVFIVIGCSKSSDNKIKKVITKNKITASSIMTKVVDRYKSEGLTDIKMTTKGTLGVDKTLNYAMIFHNYFVNKDMKKCITNLNLKINVDKTTNHINMFMNEKGNIAYALNNKTFYSADEMYSMLGIKYVAPKMEKTITKPTDEVEATKDIYNIDGTLEPTDEIELFEDEENDEEEVDVETEENLPDATPTPRKIYTLDHLGKLGSRLVIKGNKEIDGKDCYVLKGKIQGVEIRNILVTYLETSLYSIPKDFGDILYEMYIDKESYDIKGVTFNLDDLMSKSLDKEDLKDNDIEIQLDINTGQELKFPVTKEFTVDCYGNVLAAFESISKGFKCLK